MRLRHAIAFGPLLLAFCTWPASDAFAWGDEGHEIVGEIALHFLTPAAKTRTFAMLAADTTPLTAHDFVTETTWADKFRAASAANRAATQAWHFTDIEVAAPDISAACFNMPTIPTGMDASAGPAADCAVEKISEFAAELASPSTSDAERLLALKFAMHFIGDLHQPLHSSDENDRGGNNKKVTTTKLGSGELHGFWDTQFVAQLGSDPIAIGDALAGKITLKEVADWSKGTSSEWALEAFNVAKTKVYGTLPTPKANGVYFLTARYIAASKSIVSMQLSRAGVRLAAVLNQALGSTTP